MTRSLPCLALAAFVAAASAAVAQPPGSLGTWSEACEVDPDLEALLAQNALIVHKDALPQKPDGSYRLEHQPFLIGTGLGVTYNLCTNAIFYGQAQAVNVTTRSAVQVGPDLLLTAWHSSFDPAQTVNYRVVFGLQYAQTGESCLPPDFENIPASQVYFVDAVVADGHPPNGIDFLLLRLDRAVSDDYPRVRRNGRGWPEDSMTLIGHPERMAAKVDVAGVAGGVSYFEGIESLQVANLHALDRSSGSMVYNRSQRILETVANSSHGTVYELVPNFPQACYVIAHQDGFSGKGASLRHFAQHIPPFELLVDSLDPVVHVAAVGGLIDPSHSRTVHAPLTAAGPIDYQIVAPGPTAPGQPSLTIVPAGPSAGTLTPGAGLAVQETAGINGVACGVYERHYAVRDLTHGFEDPARHVFEIGVREFAVGGLQREIIADLAHPFEDEVTYPVTNPRPTPVVVRVSASENWLTLDGVTSTPEGAPVSVDVPVAPLDSTDVKVGIAPWAESFPFPERYLASLSFAIPPGDPCPTMGGEITRVVQFDYGTETFIGPAGLPIPDNSTGGLIVQVAVDEEFCVKDVNLHVATSAVPASQILARLVSPIGFRRLMWNHGSLSPPEAPLAGVLDDEPGGLPPYQSLDVFDDQAGEGEWRFRLVDDVLGHAGTLDAWSLTFEAKPCPIIDP
jgi:subtilisin-like proprotein convertase family protein